MESTLDSIDDLSLALDLDTYKEDYPKEHAKPLQIDQDDAQEFSTAFYDKVDDFLDQEGLYLICPSEACDSRRLKSFVQLRKPSVVLSDGPQDISTDDFSSKKVSSFLLKRSLMVQRKVRSEATPSILPDLSRISHEPLSLPVIEDHEMMMGPPPA